MCNLRICWGVELLYAVDWCDHRMESKVKFLCERRKNTHDSKYVSFVEKYLKSADLPAQVGTGFLFYHYNYWLVNWQSTYNSDTSTTSSFHRT